MGKKVDDLADAMNLLDDFIKLHSLEYNSETSASMAGFNDVAKWNELLASTKQSIYHNLRRKMEDFVKAVKDA